MDTTGISRQYIKLGISIIVLLISLYKFSTSSGTTRKLSPFKELMIDIGASVQYLVTSSYNAVSDTIDNYMMNVQASKNNDILRKEVLDLKQEIFSNSQVLRENNRLKKLLGFGEQKQFKKIVTQVVSWDPSIDHRVLRVNKGLKDGIELQSTAVTSKGLVGYVYRLTDHYADILTIEDSNNKIDAIIERTRSYGVIEGLNQKYCFMKYVTRTDPIILNDLVITSGQGNLYPKGLVIGKISRIERETYGISQKIRIDPAVNFSKLEEVVILVSQDNLLRQKELQALDNIRKD